ncbi:MAG: hypothetical protein JWP35_4676 [Caulobacter sp.]|nr:hypothetical protein [Caulobacter sp.]
MEAGQLGRRTLISLGVIAVVGLSEWVIAKSVPGPDAGRISATDQLQSTRLDALEHRVSALEKANAALRQPPIPVMAPPAGDEQARREIRALKDRLNMDLHPGVPF